MNQKDDELVCTELIRALSEPSAWHRLIGQSSLTPESVIHRVLTQSINLSLDCSNFTIFNIAFPLSHAPAHVIVCLVELVRRRCFENETMTAAFAFRWRAFNMDSLVDATIDRCELARQCIASCRAAKSDVLRQLSVMASSDNYFVRCRALRLRRSIQSSSTGLIRR